MVMYTQKTVELPPPPGVIGSLRAGFDAVSRHVGLILLPAMLDIFLWLGPRLSVDGLINPFINLIFTETQRTLTSSADAQRFSEFQSLFSEIVERFNLLSLLSKLQSFPVGVSSLSAQTNARRDSIRFAVGHAGVIRSGVGWLDVSACSGRLDSWSVVLPLGFGDSFG